VKVEPDARPMPVNVEPDGSCRHLPDAKEIRSGPPDRHKHGILRVRR
jgi:hypothetical protein